MQVFLNACDDQKDSHNKEIISTFNQQIIFHSFRCCTEDIISPLSYTFTNTLYMNTTNERKRIKGAL